MNMNAPWCGHMGNVCGTLGICQYRCLFLQDSKAARAASASVQGRNKQIQAWRHNDGEDADAIKEQGGIA